MPRELVSIPPGKMWQISLKRQPPLSTWTYASKVMIKPGTKMLFIGGTCPYDANGNLVGKGDLKAQIKQTIENIKVILEAEGGTLNDVVSIRQYTTRQDEMMKTTGEWRVKEFPELFGKKVGDQTGASSTCVEVVRLCDPDQLIEIDAIAAIEPKKKS